MSWFGGKKSQKVKVKDPMFGLLKQDLDYGYDRNQQLYRQGAYEFEPYGGDWVANPTAQQRQSWQDVSSLARNPWEGMAASGDYLSDVVSGKYLDRDAPGMDAVMRKTANAVNANYSMGGRYGSGAHDAAMTEGMGGILYDNYARERALQDSAAKFAPNFNQARYYDAQMLGDVGGQIQRQRQAEIDATRQKWDAGQSSSYDALKRYLGMFPSNFASQTQTTSAPGMDWGQMLLGTGLGILGF